jgi:hypothetical protein
MNHRRPLRATGGISRTNKLEHWYVRHNNVYCLRLWATCIIFRPSCTCESIKSYAPWDPIILTSLKHINYIKYA